MPKGSSRSGIGGWTRGPRPGNYTDMQTNIGCRIAKGFETAGCSLTTQAAISLDYAKRGTCGVAYGFSPCHGVGSDRPIGAYGKAHLKIREKIRKANKKKGF